MTAMTHWIGGILRSLHVKKTNKWRRKMLNFDLKNINTHSVHMPCKQWSIEHVKPCHRVTTGCGPVIYIGSSTYCYRLSYLSMHYPVLNAKCKIIFVYFCSFLTLSNLNTQPISMNHIAKERTLISKPYVMNLIIYASFTW